MRLVRSVEVHDGPVRWANPPSPHHPTTLSTRRPTTPPPHHLTTSLHPPYRRYADFLFLHRYHITIGFAFATFAFLVMACFLEPVPFQEYTLFPNGVNFHDFLEAIQVKFPAEASPLYVYIIFGLDTQNPVAYGNHFNNYDFEEGAQGSGTPAWDEGFDLRTPASQAQLHEVCGMIQDREDPTGKFEYGGLKIDYTYGINPQIRSGDTSTTGGEFGIQCLMSAFADFENVSAWTGRKFEAAPQPGGSWAHADDATCSTFDFNEDGAIPCW